MLVSARIRAALAIGEKLWRKISVENLAKIGLGAKNGFAVSPFPISE
jgi:hypothetical protein